MRENAGFLIISSIRVGKDAPFGDLELVVGYRETSLGGQYVCWYCQNETDYYWGRYTNSYQSVMEVLMERLSSYYPEAA